MKRLLIFLGLLVVLIPLMMWRSSPKQVLKRRTNRLMEVLTISKGLGGPLRQAKVYSMNSLLADVVEISAPDIDDADGTFDKQEIEAGFSWICKNVKGSDFEVVSFDEISIDGDKGSVSVSVEGFLELPSYKPVEGSHKVVIDWIEGEDGWRFHRVAWGDSFE